MNFNLVIVPTMYKQQKTEKCHHVKHKDTSMYKIFFYVIAAGAATKSHTPIE